MPRSSRKDRAQRLLDNPAPSTSTARVQAQVDDVVTIMRDNVDQVVSNLERASDLEARSSELAQSSQQFHRQARATRCLMCKRLWCLRLAFGGFCLLAIAAAVVISLWQLGIFSKDHKNSSTG